MVGHRVGSRVMSKHVNVGPSPVCTYPGAIQITSCPVRYVKRTSGGLIAVASPALPGCGLFELERNTVVTFEVVWVIISCAVYPTLPQSLCNDCLGNDSAKGVGEQWPTKSNLPRSPLDEWRPTTTF